MGSILLRQGVRLRLVAPLSPRILETYRKLDAERLELAAVRKEALRSKVRRLLLAAAALSVITHVLLLLYRYQIDQTEWSCGGRMCWQHDFKQHAAQTEE